LVECVEAGELTTPATRALVAGYVEPLVDEGVDTIVLGCTHYPFLLESIREAAGSDVAVLESAAAVAKQLRRRLGEAGILPLDSSAGAVEFWTTGDPNRVGDVMSLLWGHRIDPRPVPEPWSELIASDPPSVSMSGS
jgi:glutamate racemase